MMMGRKVCGNPTVDVPSWSPFDDQTAGMEFHLPVSGISGEAAGDYLLAEAAMANLQCYLPHTADADEGGGLADPPVDAYSCDEFRMYDFKVRRCVRGRSHDWTECPYAHPGEKARRRDPRKIHYSGTACSEFRNGVCKKGDACEFSHGVFECWLHPARYRTQPCKEGPACRRRVCFFAHTPEQLRVLSPDQIKSVGMMDSYDGSPLRHHGLDPYFPKGLGLISSSPTSTLISAAADSPPMSPIETGIRRGSWPMGSMLNDVIDSKKSFGTMDSYDGSPLRHHALDAYFSKGLGLFSSSPTSTLISAAVDSQPVSPIGTGIRRASWPMGSMMTDVIDSMRNIQFRKTVKSIPKSWSSEQGVVGSSLGVRPGFCSLPSTPTGASAIGGELLITENDEPNDLIAVRVKMNERRLSKKRVSDGDDADTLAAAAVPDFGWVSDLIN